MPPTPDPTQDEHASTRKAFEAWEKGAPPEPEEEFVLARPRSTFPPSFLLILATGCLLLGADSTADLSYELLGPKTAIDLGRPGKYALETATDGARVRIEGYASGARGTFTLWGDNYEVAPLVGIPVLIRRPPQPPVDAHSAEPFAGEGRLIKLPDGPSSFVLRLVDPAARYATVRQQFQALGELPFGKPAWLLIVGDVPRANLWAIGEPLALWLIAAILCVLAWRSHRERIAAKAARQKSWRKELAGR